MLRYDPQTLARHVASGAHTPGRTLSTRLLQKSDAIFAEAPETAGGARFKTNLRTTPGAARRGAKNMSGRAGPGQTTPQMRLTSSELQRHAPIFATDRPASPQRYQSATTRTHTTDAVANHRPVAPARDRQALFGSSAVAAAIALEPGLAQFVTETRCEYVERDLARVHAAAQAGDAPRFSAFDRVRQSRDVWGAA